MFRQKLLVLAALSVAALVPAAALADDRPAPPGDRGTQQPSPSPRDRGAGPSPDRMAAEVCAKLQEKLGDRFPAKFGSLEGCQARVGELVSQAAERCKTAAEPKGCVKEAVEGILKSLAGKGDDERGRSGEESTARFTEQACAKLQEKLGDRFAEKLGSPEACRAKVGELVSAAAERCKTAPEPKRCLKEAVEQIVRSLAGREERGGPAAAALADRIYDRLCAAAKERGKQCTNGMRHKAEEAARRILAKCERAADQAACIEDGLKTVFRSKQ